MITQDDLSWWLETAARVQWTWARTYAATAPHSYVVDGRTRGLSRADYVRAARVIHTFGQPGRFYGATNIYLTSPDGRLKWWTMDPDVRGTGLVNQATTERVYGVQNAPVTTSGIATPYDGAATYYDERHPTPDTRALLEAVVGLAGAHPPALLDVGCGTGRVLDLGLTRPDRYAGVDPSTPMLNQLVRKHPGVAAVHPMRLDAAVETGAVRPGQFEIVTMLAPRADDLPAVAVGALMSLASRGVVVAVGDSVEVQAVSFSGVR